MLMHTLLQDVFIEGCRIGKSGWTPDATGKIVLSEINHCKYYFRESHSCNDFNLGLKGH